MQQVNETTPAAATVQQPIDEDEISLLDLLIVLAKHKQALLGIPLAVAVLAAGVSLMMPNIYTATTKILPPQQAQSSASAMLGQLGALAGVAGGAMGIKNPNDMYLAMMKSRTVSDRLIERFKLMERYEAELPDDARKALDARVKASAGKDGIISIEVDDKDPAFAAELANAYVDELYKLTTTLAVTEASQRRLFFEKQFKLVKDELAAAESALKASQETTGMLELGEQSKAMISAVGSLRAQIASTEVELGAMKTFATEDNPDYQMKKQVLAGLRGQLAKLERGGMEGVVPTGKLPEVGLENVRRLRDVKYYETLFELMAKQYELARIDEAKDTSIIQVLDKAVAPDRKSKPKRALMVILSALAAGFLTVLWAFMKEAGEKARQDPEQAERLAALKQHMRW